MQVFNSHFGKLKFHNFVKWHLWWFGLFGFWIMHSRPLGMNTRGSLKNKQNSYGQLMIDVWFESIKALLWLANHNKAFMDSNHTSIINWPYKFFFVFLRPLHVLVRSNFQKCMQFVCWLFKRFAETTKMFYVSMHIIKWRQIFILI